MCVCCLLCVSVHIQGKWAEALGPGSGSFLHTVFSTGQHILCNLETFYLFSDESHTISFLNKSFLPFTENMPQGLRGHYQEVPNP